MSKAPVLCAIGTVVLLVACGDARDSLPLGAGENAPAARGGSEPGPGAPDASLADLPAPASLDPTVCAPGTNVILGTPGDDVLVGTEGADCILGGPGNDRIEGGNGDDYLAGGPGSDVILGGNGNDQLFGDDGDDQLDGGNGDDYLDSGAGNDVLVGGNGADTLLGGAGNDVLLGGNGPDTLDGGAGDDVIDSGRAPDDSTGGDGEDSCAGLGCENPEVAVAICSADADCEAGQRCAASGVCVWCLADADCDDANACTYESCQPALGCRNPNVPDGTLCLDTTVCNGTETCSVGVCMPGTPLVCGAGFECDPVLACIDIDECARALDNCDVNATCTNSIGSFSCACNAPDWEGDGVTCAWWCKPVVVGGGVERCVDTQADGSVSLHLSRHDRTVWEEEWVQAEEPEVNFCGPTAGKNLLFWHGMDVDYAVIADEMNTNTWDTAAVLGAAALACGFEPICTAIVTAIVSDAIVKAGTIPGDMRGSIYGRTPAGYVPCVETFVADLDAIRFSLSNGSPVIYLESRGEGNLHWAVVTGIYQSSGVTHLRVANSANRSWDDFRTDWSVSRVGGAVVRGLLDGLLGIKPYIMIRWEKVENATDIGGGMFACP